MLEQHVHDNAELQVVSKVFKVLKVQHEIFRTSEFSKYLKRDLGFPRHHRVFAIRRGGGCFTSAGHTHSGAISKNMQEMIDALKHSRGLLVHAVEMQINVLFSGGVFRLFSGNLPC